MSDNNPTFFDNITAPLHKAADTAIEAFNSGTPTYGQSMLASPNAQQPQQQQGQQQQPQQPPQQQPNKAPQGVLSGLPNSSSQGHSINPLLAQSMGYKLPTGALGKVYQDSDGNMSSSKDASQKQGMLAGLGQGAQAIGNYGQQPSTQQPPMASNNSPGAVQPNQINGWLKDSNTPGVSSDYMNKLVNIESNGNPNAVSPTGATGLGQMTKGTWKDMVGKYGDSMGITDKDRTDPEANIKMTAKLAQENANGFEKKEGRTPTNGELYGMHNIGMTGFTKLLNADPNAKVTKEMIGSKPSNNPRFLSGTAGEAIEKYNQAFV